MKDTLIYVRSSVAKKLGTALARYTETLHTFASNPQHRGLHLEKLHMSGPQAYYSIRHNQESRIILCPIKNQGRQDWVVTDVLEHHEYHKIKAKELDAGELQALCATSFSGSGKEEIPEGKKEVLAVKEEVRERKAELGKRVKVSDRIEFVNQRYVVLDDGQQALKKGRLPLIISGAPGSGKTSALLTMIKHNLDQWVEQATGAHPPRILIIAKSARLVEQMEKEWKAMWAEAFKETVTAPDWVTFKTPEALYQDAHPGDALTVRGEEDFINWYRQYASTQNSLHHGQEAVVLPVREDLAALVYQELHTMSGYSTLESYQSQVSDQWSLFTEPALRRALWQVYTEYGAHLSKQKSVDLAFKPITLSAPYTLIGVDETQDLSRLQLRSLVQDKAGVREQLVFCVGDHQRLFGSETTVPYLRTLFWEKNKKDIAAPKALQGSYRCAQSIVAFANAGLHLKYQANGGSLVADKNELPYIKSVASQQQGEVVWLGEKDNQALTLLSKNNRDNVDFVVITSPQYVKEAIEAFGAERVFTAKQMKGLQAKNILLYRFFEQEAFKAANKAIPDGLDLQQAVSEGKIPKGKGEVKEASIRHNIIFNEFFVACTRAEVSLTVYQPHLHTIQAITSGLKSVVALPAAKSNTEQGPVVSSKEDWLARANALREQGELDQALAIEARFAESKPQPAIIEPSTLAPASKAEIKAAEEIKNSPATNAETRLAEILQGLVAGKVNHIELLLTFPFQELKAYQGLSLNEQIGQNLPAVVLAAYCELHNISNPPAPLNAALKSYLTNFGKKNQDLQDAFMGLLYYRTSTSVPLALSVMQALAPHSKFKQTRFESLKNDLDKGRANAVYKLKRLGLLDTQDKKGSPLLHYAIAANNVKIIKALIQAGANVNSVTTDGFSPLFVAAQHGLIDIINCLIEARAEVNLVSKEQHVSPLYLAAKIGHLEVVNRLIENDAIVDLAAVDSSTALFVAVEKGHLDIVRRLIKAGADVNVVIKDGATPLYVAAKNGYLEIVNVLIDGGADVNVAFKNGATPLFITLQMGHVDIAMVLIKRGANVNLAAKEGTNADGATALFYAVREGNLAVVDELIKAGAKVNVARKDGMTPLHLAAEKGYLDIVNKLITEDANVNLGFEETITPLYFAAQNGYLEIVDALISAGALVNMQNKQGVTPLLTVAHRDSPDIINKLINKGANVNLADEKGLTPLGSAAEEGSLANVTTFIAAGAEINVQDKNGQSPLFIAANDGNLAILNALIAVGADINKVANNGTYPLFMALYQGKVNTATALIKKGAHINKEMEGISPLLLALCLKDVNVIKLLLEVKDCNVQAHYLKTETLLMTAKHVNANIGKKVEGFLKTKKVDAEGKVCVFPHELAGLMGLEIIQKSMEARLNNNLAAAVSSHRFYSSNKDNQKDNEATKDEKEGIALTI